MKLRTFDKIYIAVCIIYTTYRIWMSLFRGVPMF